MVGLYHRPGRPPARASMTATNQPGSSQERPTHTVVVPNSIDMVSVLGPGDEHLRLIERAFDASVHVRGNRITLAGESAEVATAERLLDEIVTLVRTGQGVTGETVERIIQMLRTETQERPADVLSLNILSNRGRTIRPKTLNHMVDPETIPKLLAAGTIEVAPLAFLRGRSLNDSFIILDEAQNTTPEQMKMFLTRLGF